jgi:D-serine deaminase-like pyridoxal phosphate-dependent protein
VFASSYQDAQVASYRASANRAWRLRGDGFKAERSTGLCGRRHRVVTLAYPVVRSAAIDDLLEVGRARGTDLNFIAADWTGVAALAKAALRHGLRLSVFLKVDVGLGRVGVKPDAEDAVHLAAALSDGRDLSMAGLLAHAGHAYGASDISAIREIASKEAADLTRLKARLEATGIAVPCVSVGSTPTCLGAPIPPGVDEIRPGNYAFLDRTAMRLGCAFPTILPYRWSRP